MKKLFLLVLFALPMFATAQSLKIKNGTDYPFTEVQMNYEEHSTGNLLEKYFGNKQLQPGQTFTIPNCKSFGASSDGIVEMNLSATDSDGDIYVYGEIDVCKAREVSFTMAHYVEAEGDADSDDEDNVEDPGAEEIYGQQFKEFNEFFDAEFVPAIKAASMTKFKALMAVGANMDLSGASDFTQAMLNKTRTLYNANSAELTPRVPFGSLDLSKPPVPVAYIGANFNGEDGKDPNGYYFVFNKDDDAGWKLSSIFDYTGFQGYASMMEQLEGDGDGDGSGDETNEDDVRAIRQEEYQSFQDWFNETALGLIKGNKFVDFNKLMVEGVTMSRAEFTKLRSWVTKNPSAEISPNSEMDLLQEIKPVVFLGINYNEENQEGLLFVFELDETGSWKISEFGPATGD